MTTTAIILDVLTAAALIAFTVMGAHRGFFRTVAGLLAVILALVGAQLFTSWAAPHVSGVLQPAIERRVERKVDAALGGDSSVITPQEPRIGASRPDSEAQDQKEAEEESEIQRLLRAIGVDEQLFRRLGESAREKVRDTGVTVATAVVQSVAETAIRALLLLVSFAVLLLLLKLLAKVLDLSAAGRYLAVLYTDRCVIYSSALQEYASLVGTDGIRAVLQRADGSALLLGAEEARLFVP